MIKKITVFLLLAMVISKNVNAQSEKDSPSLLEQVRELDKQAKRFNVYFNFQTSFDVMSEKNENTHTKFKARELRLGMNGNITDKVFYRFLHRLNKSSSKESLDDLAKATDLMYVGYRFSDKFTVALGKQAQVWGGFEYEYNPINVYEYSDFSENMDVFLTGITFIYDFKEAGQQVKFQITDSRSSELDDTYNLNHIKEKIEPAPMPFTYILNWDGNLWNKLFQTHWAAGVQTQAKDQYSYMLTLGNKLNLKNWQWSLDYYYAQEDIDRLGIVTNAVSEDKIFRNVRYSTWVSELEYQPSEIWNLFLKGTYDVAGVADSKPYAMGFRKAYGYSAGVELLPYKDQDLRLFMVYIGRKYDYTEESLIPEDYTNRLSIGLLYRIKAF
ncbi:OprO/OprP family phosphate-selective porin [Weeksellaceae bacterium TAE3-ERU29]|nr:OprO/OprP family phosphate-selective porin [Weeksellaceae bacterium TAE3-ERU29]